MTTKYSWRELLYNVERLHDKLIGHWRDEAVVLESVDTFLEIMRKQGVDVDAGEKLNAEDQS